jgi:hypothetical protein
MNRHAHRFSTVPVLASVVALVGVAAVIYAGSGAQAAGTPTAAAAVVAKHFDHQAHGKQKVDVSRCTSCHSIDDKGLVAAPAALGHAPCLSAGCHASDFLASGATTKKKDLARYQKAVAFCAGCHATPNGDAPNAWQRAKADNAFSGTGEYHVEMNHLAHTARTPCRECHAVDAVNFQLLDTAPGHRQCIGCHNGKPVPAMTECGMCHKSPAKTAYFTAARPGNDVRSCGAKGVAKGQSCFAHEHKGHRFKDDNSELQCGSCHFMLADKSAWNGYKYTTLRDVKASPIIENKKDRAHDACGSCHHHAADVKDGSGRARCGHCHTDRVLNSIFQ